MWSTKVLIHDDYFILSSHICGYEKEIKQELVGMQDCSCVFLDESIQSQVKGLTNVHTFLYYKVLGHSRTTTNSSYN